MSALSFPLVIDVKQRRPACVLLQAAYGCRHSFVSSRFDAKTWLLAPTDDMRLVEGTVEEWNRFADEVNAASPSPTDTRDAGRDQREVGR